MECFSAEPFARLEEANNEEDESFDTSEREELRGVAPGRCNVDVRYGPRELDVRRGNGNGSGSGEMGRLLD